MHSDLEPAYRSMSQDEGRERDAMEWSETLTEEFTTEGDSHLPPDISVLIVSWNVRELLLHCLAALPAAVGDGVQYLRLDLRSSWLIMPAAMARWRPFGISSQRFG